MSERKDTDLQIQGGGGGGYHFWIIVLYSHLSNYLLRRISKFKQAEIDITAFPAWLKGTPLPYQQHCQNTSKEKRETNICLMMLWQGSDSNHASKAKLPKAQQKKAYICSLHQLLHKGGQKSRAMQCELPTITSTKLPACSLHWIQSRPKLTMPNTARRLLSHKKPFHKGQY